MLAEPLVQALRRRGRRRRRRAWRRRGRSTCRRRASRSRTRASSSWRREGRGLRAGRGALRRHRRAVARARSGRGDRDRRFRRVRRRVAGADADRCDRAPAARRAERRGSRRSEESFVDGLLDCPHYTRPEVYAGRGGAGRAAVGAPRADPALAAQGVACSERWSGGPTCSSGRALSKEERSSLRRSGSRSQDRCS